MIDKNKEYQFEIIGEIKTKGRPRAMVRGGYAHMYTPNDTIMYENLIKLTFRNKFGKLYFDEDQPINITITGYFKVPNSMEKYEDIHNREEIACLKHKDVDNLAKIVLDALNGILFKDDKQVTGLYITKHWTYDEEKVVVEFKVGDGLTELEVKLEKDRLKGLEQINKLSAMPKRTKAQEQRLKALREEYLKGVLD